MICFCASSCFLWLRMLAFLISLINSSAGFNCGRSFGCTIVGNGCGRYPTESDCVVASSGECNWQGASVGQSFPCRR